ncbi:MAG: hypothetical protein ACXWK9_10920 [Myxococcaceae bacterium]
MSASVNGQAFTATQSATAAANSSAAISVYTVSGTRLNGTTAENITLSLYNIAATGTYPLGVNSTNFGGIATYLNGSSSWTTPLSGTAGTVIITSLTASRIAGTFSFNAADVLNPASTRSVTNGAFDVGITGTPGTVQPYQGSSMKGTLGGNAWSGATIVVISKTGGSYAFGGSTTTGTGVAGIANVNVILTGVNGPGNYALGPGQGNQLSVTAGGSGYNSSLTGSSGSVVVTSVDANRLKGTFSATLAAAGGASLVVSGGTFDIGLGK